MSRPLNHVNPRCARCHGIGIVSRLDGNGVKKARVCPCRLPGGSGREILLVPDKKLSDLERLAQRLGG